MFSLTSAAIYAQNVFFQVHEDHDHEDHDHGHNEVAHVEPGHEGHSHGEGDGLFQETWNLITDPAHAITEIFYSFLFELLIIPIIIYMYKRFREPKLRAEIHREIDAEHGIEHTDCNSETTPKIGGHSHGLRRNSSTK